MCAHPIGLRWVQVGRHGKEKPVALVRNMTSDVEDLQRLQEEGGVGLLPPRPLIQSSVLASSYYTVRTLSAHPSLLHRHAHAKSFCGGVFIWTTSLRIISTLHRKIMVLCLMTSQVVVQHAEHTHNGGRRGGGGSLPIHTGKNAHLRTTGVQ